MIMVPRGAIPPTYPYIRSVAEFPGLGWTLIDHGSIGADFSAARASINKKKWASRKLDKYSLSTQRLRIQHIV